MKWTLTTLIILPHQILHSALICLVKRLGRQAAAGRPKAAVVHGVLEGVALPAEHVVPVLAVAGPCFGSAVHWRGLQGKRGEGRGRKRGEGRGREKGEEKREREDSRVAGAEDEGLRAVGGPLGFVVELGRVPDDLQVCCWDQSGVSA